MSLKNYKSGIGFHALITRISAMIKKRGRAFLSAALVLYSFLPSLCLGQSQQAGDKALSAEAVNPVTTIINLPFQNNFSFGLGAYDRTQYLMSIQPVRLTFRAGKDFRIRSLTIIPFLYQPNIAQPEGGRFGLGDINFNFFFSNRDEHRVLWGVGPSIYVPTAFHESLGKGKWGLGPALVIAYKPKGAFLGVLANNIWSFAGNAERPKVNKLQMLPFLLYGLRGGWFLVSSPVIVADWTVGRGDKWLVPFGGGVGKLARWGGKAISLQVQVFKSLVHPRSLPYPDWTVRVQFQFLFLKRSPR